MTRRIILPLVVIALTVVALQQAASHGVITPDTSTTAAHALVLAVLAVVVAGAAEHRGDHDESLATAVVGLSTTVAAFRFLPVAAALRVAGEFTWLATGPVMLAAILVTGGAPIRSRRVVTVAAIGLGSVVAALPALAPGSMSFDRPIGASLPDRAMLLVHTALLGALAAAVITALWRQDKNVRRVPLTVASAVWTVTALGERVVALLPDRAVRSGSALADVRPWADVVGARFPLGAAVLALATMGFVTAIQPRLRRSPDGRVLIDADDPLTGLSSQLSAWVGDPTVRLAFPTATGGLVDLTGAPHRPAPGRSTTVLGDPEAPLAVIEHDPAIASGELVTVVGLLVRDAAAAQAALASTAMRLAEQRRLTARLLAAEPVARAEVLHELEQGPLARLQHAALRARHGTVDRELLDELKTATAEVRELSHGLVPPSLADGGLAAVFDRAAGVPVVRFPAAIELTAWLAGRDDPSVAFIERPGELVVHRSVPLDDPRVQDRIVALGGRFDGTIVVLPTGG